MMRHSLYISNFNYIRCGMTPACIGGELLICISGGIQSPFAARTPMAFLNIMETIFCKGREVHVFQNDISVVV